jgi:hypothetical protein
MPTIVSMPACLVWFAFGFFVGLGWALAAWLVAKATAARPKSS